jgi:NAD(P)H-dependent flavin oxidoreductase YrpB (nitropropane dioxygenase family)
MKLKFHSMSTKHVVLERISSAHREARQEDTLGIYRSGSLRPGASITRLRALIDLRSILVPACADACKTYTSPLNKKPVLLVAGGGVSDGRSLAAAIMLGAGAVWVGTRFVASLEAGAPEVAKRGYGAKPSLHRSFDQLTSLFSNSIVNSDFNSAIVTTVFTGRPLRAQSNPYLEDWEKNRQTEIKNLTSRGILPLEHELDRLHIEGKLTEEIEDYAVLR